MTSILITGASGSFGNAFVRRLLDDSQYDRIIVYSRDELKQADMRLALHNDTRLRWFVGDVRDKDRLTRAMRGVYDVVHAAALKRIEVGRYCPDEMTKTNVIGAMNVIDAAQECGVRRVVALSTDKAVQPISAYGQSKALAESLFLAANDMAAGPKYSVVRYGNVWCSRGSVVPTWRKMIEDGAKEVPVTHPDATRYMMTQDQAVKLVLDALVTTPREVLTPKLPAYRLIDLVSAFGVGAQVTGLPPWEKMHESMRIGETSETAPRLTVGELRAALATASPTNGVHLCTDGEHV